MMIQDRTRALVVDDDVVVRQATVRALTLGGFVCDVASDGKQALVRLAEREFDLAVTDLRMPVMNGHQLAVEMLALESRPAIIVLTGVPHPKLVRDLVNRGVECVMAKPADYDELVLQARAFVERRELAAKAKPKAVAPVLPTDVASPEDTQKVTPPTTAPSPISSLPADVVLAAAAPRASTTKGPENRVIGFAAGDKKENGETAAPAPAPGAADSSDIADCLDAMCRDLPPTPTDFDAFRVASGNTFGIPELLGAIQSQSGVARGVLMLANGAYYRLTLKLDNLEHQGDQKASFVNLAFCLAVAAASLLLGVMIGHFSFRVML